MPQRIQRKRTKGWRMPQGAVYVGRPTRWGNHWARMPGCDEIFVNTITCRDYMIDAEKLEQTLVDEYRLDVLGGRARVTPDEIRTELAGHDLACWCPLDEPCHADVLLELANQAAI